MKMNQMVHYVLIGMYAVLLAGCAAGPDFQRPAPPDVSGYTAEPLMTLLDCSPGPMGNPQRIVAGEYPARDWWREMGNETMNMLIDEALKRNPTLTAAKATLHQAQELYAARAGSTTYPVLEGNLGGQRQRSAPAALGQTGEAQEFSLYNAGISVGYTFDLSGGNRRALEALSARSDYRQFELEGAWLTLAAEILTTAISRASLKKQAEIMESMLKLQENQMALTRERIRLGHGEPDDILALQTQLEQTRAKVPQLWYQIRQSEHLLAVLAGRAPGEGGIPSFDLEDFMLPPELPLLIPSGLVRSRPDILGAEALLHAANADYGVAVAKLYPQINLSASLGSQALSADALFDVGSTVWSLVGQLTQPLFNPGLSAEKRAALAAFDAAAANYRFVVLQAFRNVADVLRALENDAKRLKALAAADDASGKFLESVQRRYGLGVLSYYELLIAQQQRLQTGLDLTEAQARRLLDTAAFYQAMGGGRVDVSERAESNDGPVKLDRSRTSLHAQARP